MMQILAGNNNKKNQNVKLFDISRNYKNIDNQVEKGEVPLDDMVKKYTEAMELVKFCNQKLSSATETVNKILTEDGSLTDFKTE